jgi:Membrane-bound metallopeptidase
MSELRNAAARGESMLQKSMKAEFIKTQQQARSDGNSQQKGVTAFAEDEVAEKARTSAVAAGQTARHVGRTAVQNTSQSADELKIQAKAAKAQLDKARTAAAKKKAAAAQKKKAATASQPSGSSVRSNRPPSTPAASRSGNMVSASQSSAKQAYRKKQAGKTISSYRTTSKSISAVKSSGQAAGRSLSLSYSGRAGVAAGKTAHAANAAKNAYKKKQYAKRAADASRKTIRATVEAVKVTVKSTKALVTLLIAGGWVSVIIILIVVIFGCAISMFGGGSNSKSYTAVSVEVRDYRPVIQQYAKEHGIPEYVDLIMAVMMQESGGQGLDPMQASECSYNTRYLHHAGSIVDPEYSINVGIQNLAACLKAANVQSPIDMDNIKLALQGYNYGNGYIAWAKEHYKGYSTANALEFSDMMAKKKGWSSYGDSNYVLNVLRYYPIGRAFTAGGNQVIVEIASAQVGNKGGQPYWSWYGFKSRIAWCACYVSWCADQCGYIDAGIIPKFSLCSDGVAWFKKNGQWQDRNYLPQAGDLIFFDWEGDGRCNHVGIVEKCEDGVVYTIEGNSGNACKRQHYAVGSRKIYGYGCPMY